MSYHQANRRHPFVLSGVSSAPLRWRVPRVPKRSLGSLGDDQADPIITQPTLSDPTENAVWRADVLSRLSDGVQTMQANAVAAARAEKMAEMQKWAQIAATLSIPLAGVIWKWIFKRGAAAGGDGLS